MSASGATKQVEIKSTGHHPETSYHTMYNDIFAAYKPENEINKDVELQDLFSVNWSVQLSVQCPSWIC
jgi:hypothetical protein